MYIFILLLILSYECEFDRHYSLSFGYECSTFSSVHLSFICHKRTCQHKWGEYSERINDFVCTKPYSLQSSLRFCHLIRLRFSLIVCLVITGLRWKQKTRKLLVVFFVRGDGDWLRLRVAGWLTTISIIDDLQFLNRIDSIAVLFKCICIVHIPVPRTCICIIQ